MTDQPLGTPYERVKALMERLRADCPWDSAQSFDTIAPYTIEEAYEVGDAIARRDMEDLKTELGDLLFQVLFHSKLAEEIGAFNMDDVCHGLVEKMVRRHPHVYGDAEQPDWDGIKAQERKSSGQTSVLDGVALSLPELMRAEKLQKRAAKTGFDWPNRTGVTDKIQEELAEVEEAASAADPAHIQEEIGDLLFSVVNLARHLGTDPELALRQANAKFSQRFRHVETRAGDALADMSLEDMEALWVEAKS